MLVLPEKGDSDDDKRGKEDQAESVIVACKQEIMKFVRDKEEEAKAWKEYSERINAIPGLIEIEAAKRDLEKWHDEWDASFDDVGGLGVRSIPKYDFKAMLEKYPQAAAYLKAREYSEKRNLELSAIGDRALKEVIFTVPARTGGVDLSKLRYQLRASGDRSVFSISSARLCKSAPRKRG